MALPVLRGPEGGVSPLAGLQSGADVQAQLDVLLFSGGGEALWPHPVTRKARDGAGLGPDDAEIWFSSTTATSATRHGRAAARAALERLAGHGGYPMPLTLWFNALRARIAGAVGAPNASVLLAPSPAEARALARFIATALFGRAPVEIVGAPEESGDASAPGAGGQRVIELRDSDGMPLARDDIDAEAKAFARAALEADAAVLVHALDLSRTGLGGVSRAAARRIRAWAPARALVLIDASEWRAAQADLAADLAEGAMVMVSGSHFVAGPAHCAALILPPALAQALEAAAPLFDPDVSPARFDLPAGLRNAFAGGFDALMNIGLGLRWSAALAEHDRYLAVPPRLRGAILEAFSRRARALAARRDCLDLEPRLIDDDDPLRASILALIPRDPRGGRAGFISASAIRAGLALPRDGVSGDAICHIGAPVRLGSGAALPLAASAPMVAEVCARMASGASFERALAPIWRDLDTLFDKWDALAG